jgi:hypothetical protein
MRAAQMLRSIEAGMNAVMPMSWLERYYPWRNRMAVWLRDTWLRRWLPLPIIGDIASDYLACRWAGP